MTKEELAAQLCCIEYGARIPGEVIIAAQSSGLVILCGASDDLMEFYGARREEIGCYGGGSAYVDADGVLPDRDCLDGDEEIAEYVHRQKSARTIEALWCQEDGYSWIYKTDIPHATFHVLEDDAPYCRGIVFALADLA